MDPSFLSRAARYAINTICRLLGFVELGEYLCEVRSRQYWRLLERLKSFDEFLEKLFPESRRKAYYLMAIHEHLRIYRRSRNRNYG